MKLNKFTRILCLAIVSVMIMASTAMAVNVNSFVDFPNDWSTPAMEYAVENGLIKGYEDNTIRADRNITRAEMGAIVNRAFGSFVEATKFPYLDVEDIAWFYRDMKKAVNMGTMQGSNNLLRPDDAITREEAFIVIARAYSQKNTEFSVLEQYGDYENISGWAKEYLSFLTENDYVNGFDDGNLYPKSNLTRAELSQVLYNMISEYVASQEVLDAKTEYDGNIIINGKISNITGKTFKGDLVIGDGVGVEKIVIKDTKIEGCLTVRGTTQIRLVNTTVGNRIIVNNPNNNVHFDNYKTEKVFNNVEVQTSATWKKYASSGGKRYFTVTFVDENGYMNSITVAEGTTVSKPADPTRTGYTFGGWYTNENCTTPFDFTTPVNGNLTIYAKWIPNKYTVTFNYNGGTPGITEKEVTYDSTYGEFPVTGRDGYTFDGWFIGNEKIVADTQVKITANTEVKAKWTAKTYTLSFDPKGGSAVADKTVTYDSAIGMLTIPVKTGYTFKGWTIDGDLINLTTVYKFAANKVAEANWEANKYTLTFQGLADEIEVTYDGKYPTLPAGLIQAGKTFVGWFDGSTQIKEGNPVKITEDTHLVPKYTDKPVYTVTFDANGGSGSLTQNVIEGEKAVKPTDPTREGYDFKGWYNEPSGDTEFDFNTPITSTKTVYAKWEIKTYKVTFKDWNGNTLDTQTVNYNGTAIYGGEIPSRASDGTYTYTFDGWDKSLVNITEDITVTAKYISTYIDYTVKFVAEGTTVETFIKHYNDVIYVADFPAVPSKIGHNGVWSITTDITVNSPIEVNAIYTPATYKLTFEGLTNEIYVTYGDNYPTLPTPSIPHGQNFVGWFDGSTEIKAGNKVEITKDTKLVPVFTDKNVYTVKFNANGGTPNSTQSVIEGDKAVKPTDPTREGHTFKGWFKDTEGTQVFDFDTEITGNIELYAGWSLDTYTITFKNWDGSVLETKEIPYGTTASYTGATPEKPADVQYTYTFSGWSPALGTVTGEATYTAQFEKTLNKYTYTFYDEDGTTVLKEATVDYGTTIEAPANPTKAADAQYTYTFKEWEGYTDGMTVAGDVTFKAVYEKSLNSYTITFKNWDGSVLETKEIAYGTTPEYTGAKPLKDADAQYTYTFSGWSPALETVTGEATYTAQFEKTLNKYTYTFYDEDGTTVLKEATVDYGTVIVAPANPTKVADVQYTYTFKEWDGYTAGMTVAGDVTFKAVYEKSLNSYTITFKNWDGSVLETKEIAYGTTPEYTGAKPLKDADAQYTYTFSGWSPALETVTGEATYTAQFEKTLNKYTYTFYDEDGTTVLKEATVNYGTTIEAPANPTKAADAQYTYTFKEWEGYTDGMTVAGDVTFKAVYEKSLNSYTITFKNWDGSVLETKEIAYGTTPEYTGAKPLKDADAQYTYTFSGWSPALETVTGEATYTAQFEKTLNKYTYTFYDEDGTTVLKEATVDYGTVIVAPANPTKVADVQYTYTFKEWEGYTDGMTVAGDVTFKAVYDKTLNQYTYTFYDEDGTTVLKEATVDYGTVIVAPANPTKAADVQYTYTFKEWDGYTAGMTVAGDVTFKAVYEKTLNQYTYTFYDEDGTTVLKEATVAYGTTIVAPADPTKTGEAGYTYTFKEWEGYTDGMTVAGDVTFKAVYDKIANEYVVKYDGNGALGNTPESYFTYDVEDRLEYNGFLKVGNNFLGWSENPNATTPTYTEGQLVKNLTTSGEITLYAIWQPKPYYVSYHANTGTGDMSNSTHYYGVPSPLSKNVFEKIGYTFKGWSEIATSTDFTYADEAIISDLRANSETVTLFAIWEANKYTIKFNGNDHTSGSTESMTDVEYDKSYNLTVNGFAKTGYTFKGWATEEAGSVVYKDGESVTNLTDVPNGTVNLYAVWEPITYKVKFVSDWNNAENPNASYEKDFVYDVEEALTPNKFTRTGWVVVKWIGTDGTEYEPEALVKNLASTEGAVVKLTASWMPIEYTVVYEGNGADTTSIPVPESEHKYDDPKNLNENTFTKEGYTFKGWRIRIIENPTTYSTRRLLMAAAESVQFTDQQEVTNLTDISGAKVILEAIWEANKYFVEYNKNDPAATGTMTNSEHIYDTTSALSTNGYSLTGYTFGGWAKTAGGNAEINDGEDVLNLTAEPNGKVTLYATWTENSYTVKFDGNGETSGEMSDMTYTYTESKALNENKFERTGYTFDGWATTSGETTAKYTDKEAVSMLTAENNGTVTLYAVWKPITYFVRYNGNGATEGTMSDSTHTYDKEEALTANAYKKAGFAFKGWDTDPAGETVVYKDAALVKNLADEQDETITLYAVWGEEEYKVIYDGNGATEGSMDPSTHITDTPEALSKNAFKKSGHNFLGWSEDKDAKVATYTDEQVVVNLTTEKTITLYAIWEEATYKLTFDVNGGNALELTAELEALGYYLDGGKVTVDVTYNGKYPQFPTATYPEGEMSFGGWSLEGEIVASGDTVEIEKDTELVAVWTNKHIVIFHGYYNDGTESYTTYVEDGETAEKPENPVHSQFTFDGWYTNEECTDGNEYDFATIINKVNDEYQTIHLYPRWLITVRFYYGPEAIESEKQAEITVQYNNVIAEEDVPASRTAYGYWKDASVSEAYVGEEYEHNIEFMWHEASGEEFELFDLTQPITKSVDLFNIAKIVDINVSSSFDAINGANVNAVYTDNEALYENILDVIFANGNLVNSVYEKIEQKEKVFDKLESLGIIDENKNILNQAKFLKFALMGEERLEEFVYENVESELAVDAKESISSYLNHLIAKNDGSAESFIRELIETLLKGDGKEAMKGVLKDMLTEMVDLEKDEFVKHINDYIDNSLAEGDTTSVETLIAPQIERLLTEAIAKDFVRKMTKEQLTNFVNIYVGTLTEDELKSEVKAYIEALEEAEIEAEVIEYVNSLSNEEVEAEITKYIDSLSKDQLKEEIFEYVNELENAELKEAIVEHINTLTNDQLKTEIKSYFDGLSNEAKKAKIEEFFDELTSDEIKSEIIDYINGLSEDELTNEISDYIRGLSNDEKKAEVETYINGLKGDELKTEIKGYINGLADDELEAEIKKYIESLGDEGLKAEIKKYIDGFSNDELIAEIKTYIKNLESDAKKAEIEKYIEGLDPAEREGEVTSYVKELTPDSFKAEIKGYIEELENEDFAEELKTYLLENDAEYEKLIREHLGLAADAPITDQDKLDHIDDVVNYVVTTPEKKAEAITNAANYITTSKRAEYEEEIIKKVTDNFEDYTDEIVNKALGANLDAYIEKAAEKVVYGPDKEIYVDRAIENIVIGAEKDTYISNAINKILDGTERDTYISNAVDKIVNGTEISDYVAKAVNKIINDNKLEDYIPSVAEKLVKDKNYDSYVTKVVDKIIDEGKLDEYIGKAVDSIAGGAKLDTYLDRAIDRIVTGGKKESYINETANAIVTGNNKQAYVEKAAETIVNNPELKAKYTERAIDKIVNGGEKAEYVEKAIEKILTGKDRDKYINDTINKIFTDGKYQSYIDKAVAKIVDKTPADYSEIDKHIENMFATAEKKQKLVKYINDQFIESGDFREAILPDAIDMIFEDEEAKTEVVETIVDYVMNDEDAFEEMINIAIEDLVDDADFREKTIDKIAHYLEDHPEIMEKVVEYAKESELGVFVEKFVDELLTKDQFEVSEENLFVAEAIERAVSKYDYDSFMNEYVPDRFAGLIPDSILKPIYENALGGFKAQLDTAIEAAKNGEVAYVDSGVTVKFNPIADIIVPVFDKYLEFKDKAEDKLDSNNGTVGNIYDNAYGENKYLKELVNLIAIESLLDGDKSLATEELSGYSLKEFIDYYEIIRNATVLLTDTGRWYIEKLPKDKAEAAQEKVAQKVTEYFNSVLALVNTYAETEELPSYKDVLEIFEGDIPNRFFAKYESALGKVEAKVDIDDKLETVYNKLAEKGVVSKFNTVLDKFIASKFNREITEEQIPLVYTFVRRALGYDDFYTVDTVFNVMNEYLTRFKVNEDKFEIGNNKLTITIERSYK